MCGGAEGGFVPVNDQGDAYKLLYPFGWQEVSVTGQDVVYKDIIEPLESVSVNMVPTDKEDITLFGTPEEVLPPPPPPTHPILWNRGRSRRFVKRFLCTWTAFVMVVNVCVFLSRVGSDLSCKDPHRSRDMLHPGATRGGLLHCSFGRLTPAV